MFRFSTHTEGRRNSNLLCDSWERRPLRPDSGKIPGCYSRKPGFTETRLRPLARRRDRTFWPPWVFMRERNPCFFDRLRRLGWNVRLGIEKYLLLIRSAVLGQTESINQPSHYRQTPSMIAIGDGIFLNRALYARSCGRVGGVEATTLRRELSRKKLNLWLIWSITLPELAN